jgi:hypothetical protein
MIIDENFGDISFVVGGQQMKNNAKKVIKTAPVVFHAHQYILRECSAGTLADMCESNDVSSSPIKITDVSPVRHLLYSVYGVNIIDEDMKWQTNAIINAANRYGVVNLKLEAEAYLVEATTFTMENVMEQLHFVVENSAEVMDISFNDIVSPTLFRDVLAAVSRREKKSDVSGGGDGDNKCRFNSMRISELRRESHEKGLNVDGSREMLIAALKGA